MKKLAVALFLVIAAFAVFLLLDSPKGTESASPSDLERGGANRSVEAPVATTRASDRPVATTRFAELEASHSAGAEAESLRVLVIDDSTGIPVPGAEVAWADRSALDPWQRGFEPLLSQFDTVPQRTITDDRGLATVTTSPKLVVGARRDELFGIRSFNAAPKGEIRLPIKPGWVIAAQVMTAWGTPAAGIPIAMKLAHTKPQPGSSSATITTRAPDGIAIMQHTSSHRPAGWSDTVFSAWIDGIEASKVEAPVDALRNGPLRITLPPVGQLRVEVQDDQGKPFMSEATIQLGIGPGRSAAAEKRAIVIPAPSLRATVSKGVATFPFAPVGLPLVVVGSAEGFDLAAVDLDPLESTTTEKSAVLRFQRRKSQLVGRLVDQTKTPLSRRSVRVELTDMSRVGFGGKPLASVTKVRPFETDAEGRFAFPAVDRNALRNGGLDVDFEVEGADGVVAHAGSVNVAALSDEDETPIGDVELAGPEILASGTVVDERGATLSGVTLTARIKGWAPKPGRDQLETSRGVPLGQVRMSTRSNASGAFTLSLPAGGMRAPMKIQRVEITGELEGHAQRAPAGPYDAGQRDVKVVLEGVGVIEGALRLPPDLPVCRIEMNVTGSGSPKPRRFEDCVDSDGHFRLAEIFPGTATLVITKKGSDAKLAMISDIAVPRAAVASDARLQLVDLTGQ